MFHISPLQTSFVVCLIYKKKHYFMTWTCHKMRALNSERDTATDSSKSPTNKMVFRTCTFWSPFFLSLFIINNSYTLFKDLFSLKIEKLNKLNLPTQFPFPHHYTKPSLNALHGYPAKSQSQIHSIARTHLVTLSGGYTAYYLRYGWMKYSDILSDEWFDLLKQMHDIGFRSPVRDLVQLFRSIKG